jgi:hypothetical protein
MGIPDQTNEGQDLDSSLNPHTTMESKNSKEQRVQTGNDGSPNVSGSICSIFVYKSFDASNELQMAIRPREHQEASPPGVRKAEWLQQNRKTTR